MLVGNGNAPRERYNISGPLQGAIYFVLSTLAGKTRPDTRYPNNIAVFHIADIFHPERVSDDPWKLLIAVMLLNKTSGTIAIPIFWQILNRWPTPLLLSQGATSFFLLRPRITDASNLSADELELIDFIRRLGLQRTRSKRLILLSKMYLDDPPTPDNLRPSTFKIFGEWYKPTPVSHLPGSGAYALDSYRIFYSGDKHDPQEWKFVMPSDKELIRHLVRCFRGGYVE
jgi:methyl-CpG-binding domain protein 4